MAVTDIGDNSPQNVQRWAKKLFRESIGKTFMRKFMHGGERAILCLVQDLEQGAGDTVKYDLLMQMEGAGVDGDTRMKGFEEALVYHQDEIKIDQKRNGHAFRTMSQQRTVHNLRTDAKTNLADWFAVKYDRYMLSYLAGTAGDDPKNVASELPFAGNALQPPDAAHVYAPGATMSLKFIDYLVEKAKTIDPLIRPCMVDGEAKFVLLLHPYSVAELRTTAGDNEWALIQARAGARGGKNPIYTGALGEYAGVVLHESEYIPRTGGGTPLTHNLFLGAQAGTIAFGNSYKRLGRTTMGKGSHFSWFEDNTEDYGNETGVAAGAIFGVKKARFNGADFGSIRLDTQDVAHT